MKRRELLAAGWASAALALMPREAQAAVAVWEKVEKRVGASARAAGFSDEHRALVGTMADAFLPRTDTPSATDVGVPEFVEVVLFENEEDAVRDAFIAGLDEIGAIVRTGGAAKAIEAIEAMPDREAQPAKTHWRLKGLVVHGYFTSKPVMQQVLRTQVLPGKFEEVPLRRHAHG